MLAPMTDEQIANVLAALALHLSERIEMRTESAAEHGSSAPSALVVIFQHPGETIDHLSKALNLTHSGTVRLVDRLLADNLLTKTQGKDARAVALACTATGKSRAKATLRARKAEVEPIVASLTSNERAVLESILRKIPWEGVASARDGIHTCRLCDIDICFMRGNCPVTIARLSAGDEVNRRSQRRNQQPYDPADPDRLPASRE